MGSLYDLIRWRFVGVVVFLSSELILFLIRNECVHVYAMCDAVTTSSGSLFPSKGQFQRRRAADMDPIYSAHKTEWQIFTLRSKQQQQHRLKRLLQKR